MGLSELLPREIFNLKKPTLYRQSPSSDMGDLTEGDEEEARLEEEQETKLAEMEAEMEKEKEQRKLAGASEEEIHAALELLQKQHEAKRKVRTLFDGGLFVFLVVFRNDLLCVHVVVKTVNLEISRCHLPDYVKELY